MFIVIYNYFLIDDYNNNEISSMHYYIIIYDKLIHVILFYSSAVKPQYNKLYSYYHNKNNIY